MQAEIDDLRQKINAIGSVNLEALEELQSLEARHENLSRQFKDLSNAKAALEKIIEKINTDSRRLFSETLQTVREHFQSLFRDLFGGGHADIVLEEAVDILESGVEIVARPPGKEPRSISLLSGGEKTLTCVALSWPFFAAARVRSACSTRWTRCWMRRTSTASPRSFATSSPGRSSSLSRTEEDDDVRGHDLRGDDAGIGGVEASVRPLRGRQRRRPHSFPAARGGGQHAGGMIARGGGPAFPP